MRVLAKGLSGPLRIYISIFFVVVFVVFGKDLP